jgi:hypothetical protein
LELPKLTGKYQYLYYSDYINLSKKNVKMQNSVNSGALVGSWVSITLQNFHPRLKIKTKKKITTQIQITHRLMTVNVSKLHS